MKNPHKDGTFVLVATLKEKRNETVSEFFYNKEGLDEHGKPGAFFLYSLQKDKTYDSLGSYPKILTYDEGERMINNMIKNSNEWDLCYFKTWKTV